MTVCWQFVNDNPIMIKIPSNKNAPSCVGGWGDWAWKERGAAARVQRGLDVRHQEAHPWQKSALSGWPNIFNISIHFWYLWYSWLPLLHVCLLVRLKHRHGGDVRVQPSYFAPPAHHECWGHDTGQDYRAKWVQDPLVWGPVEEEGDSSEPDAEDKENDAGLFRPHLDIIICQLFKVKSLHYVHI